MLFLKLLFGVLLCLAISWLFSWLFFWRKDVKSFQNIIVRFILGSFNGVAVYAIIAAKFHTVFALAIPLLFSIGYLLNKQTFETTSIKKHQIFAFIIFLFVAICFGFLNVYGIDFNGLKVPINDQSYYTSVANCTTHFSSESSIAYLNQFYNFEKTIILYHYYEYWFTSFIYQITHFNVHFILNGIITSFSLFSIFTACYLLLNSFTNKYHWLLVIASILCLFLRGINHYFPNSELDFIQATDSILFDGNQKLVYPLPFFILGIYFVFTFAQKQLGLLVLMLLPILNIVFSPSIYGAFAFYFSVVICLSFKSILTQLKEHLLFIINAILFIILLAIFIKYSSMNLGKEGFVTSIGGILSNIFRNLKLWFFLQLPLLCAICYFIYVSKNKHHIYILALLLGIVFSGALGYAILDNNQNAWQMFACASRLSVIGLFLFLIHLSKKNLKYFFIIVSLVSILSLLMFLENYSTISHLPLKKISSYSSTYIQEISKLKFKNKVGIKYVNAATRPNLQRNPVYAGIVNYFCLTENAYSTVVMNVQDLMLMPKDTIVNFEVLKNNAIVKEIITFSPFLSANKMGNSSYNIKSLEDEQEKFIRKYLPEFCILENGIQLPENIKKYVSKSLYDKGTKEQFLLLKY